MKKHRSNIIRLLAVAIIATTLINGKCEEKVVKSLVTWLCYIDFFPGCRQLLTGGGGSPSGLVCSQTGCCPGRCVSRGYVGGGPSGPDPFLPSPITPTFERRMEWQCSPFGTTCGKTVYTNTTSRCLACISFGVTPSVSLVGDTDSGFTDPVGYDAQGEDNAAPVAVYFTPGPLDFRSSIIIQFSESMDPDAVEIAGFAVGADYLWDRTADYNDTLTIVTDNGWTTGSQNLSVSVADTSGNTATVTQGYMIRDMQADQAAAAVQAEQVRLAWGWPPADGPLQIADQNGNYFQTHLGGQQAVYATPAYAVVVYGDIYLHYVASGLHNGPLGLPISSEYDCGLFLRCSDFENGRMTWNAITRVVVTGPR